MKKFLITVIAVVIFALPAYAEEDAENVAKLQALKERYTQIETLLAGHKAKAGQLKEAGYGGRVLRKDYKELAGKIVALIQELARLDIELKTVASNRLPSKLPKFKIVGTMGSHDGPLISGPVSDGDMVAFRAEVIHPEFDPPPLTELMWQLFDPDGNEKTAIRKRLQTSESGKTLTYEFGPITINAKSLKNGKYRVALTHRLYEKPKVSASDIYTFILFQPLKITSMAITSGRDDKTEKSVFYNDERPYVTVDYEMGEGVESVDVMFVLKDGSTGAEISSKGGTQKRKEGTNIRTAGIWLKQGRVKPGGSGLVEITITSPAGDSQTASKSFSVKYYDISLDVPGRLKYEESGSYRITVPPSFSEPYTVDISASDSLNLNGSSDSLSGTFSGNSGDSTVTAQVWATVTDSEGRVGKTSGRISVLPEPDKEPVADVEPTPSYTPPIVASPVPEPEVEVETTSSSTPAPTVDYVALGKERFSAWLTKEANWLFPGCLSELKTSWKSNPPIYLNNAETEQWGKADIIPLYNLKQEAMKFLLQVLIKQLKEVVYSQCFADFAGSIAASASVIGIANQSDLYDTIITAMQGNSAAASGSSGSSSGGLSNVGVDRQKITITFYDDSEVDGDQIDISVNGKMVVSNHVLVGPPGTSIELWLNSGANTFTVHADNVGSAENPKNSAALVISNVVSGSSTQNWKLDANQTVSITINVP